MDTMITKILNKQDGLTVIELLIVLTLILLVLAIGFMYFDFGVKAFDRGERQTIAQKAARITSDFITSELRFAKEITINPDGNPGDSEGYYYFYEENNSIKFLDPDEATPRTLADTKTDGITYNVYFFSNIPYDVVIFYIFADLEAEPESSQSGMEEYKENVENLKQESLYALKTRVQAINLKLFRDYDPETEEMITINEGGDHTVIKYKKP